MLVSIARMHHIRNPKKYRRLVQCAEHSKVSGLVKKGQPGVLVFQGTQHRIKDFLACAKALRYLDFHHVATLGWDMPVALRSKEGLTEVESMRELVDRLEQIGGNNFREWFRKEMGMR